MHIHAMTAIFMGLLILDSISFLHADSRTITQKYFSQELTNLVYYNDTVYVAGNGQLHALSKDLEQVRTVTTCDGTSDLESCNNVNKVLVLNRLQDALILCGTGNRGTCQEMPLSNISSIDPAKWRYSDDSLRVSNDTRRPAVALINEYGDELMIGVTFGPNIEAFETSDNTLTYKYVLSTWSAHMEKHIEYMKMVRLSIPKHRDDHSLRKPVENFLFYYKAAFQNIGFSYFFTNQKNRVGDRKYISKMIRICQQDSLYNSYADLVIECKKDGKDYNLLQDATIVEPGSTPGVEAGDRLFVGTFTSADNPEDVSGDSAICVERLSVLNVTIMEAKKEAISCSVEPIPKEQRYLEQMWNCEQTTYNETYALCTKGVSTYKYVIGQTPFSMVPVFMLPSDQGYITTISGHVVEATNTVVVQAGTSKGHLIQLSLVKLNESLKEIVESTLDEGSTIRAIHRIHGDREDVSYVLSTHRIFKYVNTYCTKFSSCEDAVRGYNPYCGWCVYEQRSSTKAECGFHGTNHWLSFKDECVKIEEISPQKVPAIKTNELNMTVSSLPKVLSGDHYECRVLVYNNIVSTHTAKLQEPSDFECLVESVSVHTKGVVQLWVVNGEVGDVKLAQTDILFYKCDHYRSNSCIRCLSLKKSHGLSCDWCGNSLTCQTGCHGVWKTDHCPRLLHHSVTYVPSNVSTKATFVGAQLMNAIYTCSVPVLKRSTIGIQDQNNITCDFNLEIPPEAAKRNYDVVVRYELSGTGQAKLDSFNKVTVYKCENLAKDCSHCRALNSTRYQCDWCASGSCGYKDGTCEPTSQCPVPVITQIEPQDGPTKGNTVITLSGTDLGMTLPDTTRVTIGDIKCSNVTVMQRSDGPDFEKHTIDKIGCTLGSLIDSTLINTPMNVTVFVNATKSVLANTFVYKEPRIWNISPAFGPRSGGTRVTFTGDNLGVGNHIVTLKYNKAALFTDCTVTPMINYEDSTNNFTIECTAPLTINHNMTLVQMFYGSSVSVYNFAVNFTVLEDPVVDVADISPKKAILSGGTMITIMGDNLNHANRAKLIVEDQHDQLRSPCEILSRTEMVCETPAAPSMLRSDMEDEGEIVQRRRRRETSCHCKEETIRIQMDGWSKNFSITYYLDPIIEEFQEEVTLFHSDQQTLVIRGRRMTLVASDSDITIMVGTEECSLVQCTSTELSCQAPRDQPKLMYNSSHFPEVVVMIGNYEKHVGYLQYANRIELYLIILSVAGGVIILTVAMGLVFVVYRCKRQGRKIEILQQKMIETEMEVRNVAKEEFLDMNIMMSSMNKSLVENGFPFHGYHQFASNVIFASECRFSEVDTQEELPMKTKIVMDSFETLLLNKFFILSVISTMEKQKKFFQRERAVLAGNLCAILMGKMDYLQEILKSLLNDLVYEAVGKKQYKTLFKRCESITENILNNWLVLTHYPQLKWQSGSPLYLLFLAMQKAIEAGPIDAITDDTKYMLCEESLLRKWSSTEPGRNEVKFEAKPLTLKVIVDNGDQVFDCRALDCDTITQVKAKCLNQIYVNYPASRLNIDPTELCLEWVTGETSGKVQLMDEDSTSVSDGDWLRLNTLAHYNVHDNSNMILRDPKYMDEDEDMSNIQQDVSCNNSLDTRQLLNKSYTDNSQLPLPSKRWHLVKPLHENNEKLEKSATESLYLSRLFTTKNMVLEYMNQLFSVILDANQCTPPAKFLCDFLDTLGERHTLDPMVVQGWKSHSHVIRMWGSLLKQPSILFDVQVPSYMESSLNAIAQVFIDSMSTTSQKLTAKSTPQRLVFNKEVTEYQEKVKVFYEEVSQLPQSPDELRQYLHTVNKIQQQQQQQFQKTPHLYKLYQQLYPYLDDIVEELSTNENTQRLGLHRRLEQIVTNMSNNV